MARLGQLVTRIDGYAAGDSVGTKVYLHGRALDQDIIDIVTKRQRLNEADIHDMRVNLKRLRAMRHLIYFETSYGHFKKSYRNLRDAGRILSGRRDQTVLGATLKKLAERAGNDRQTQNVLAVHSRITNIIPKNELKDKTLQNKVKTLIFVDRDNWQQLQDKLAHTGTLVAGLARTHYYSRSLGQRAMRSDAVSIGHRWRKWVKYLYYQVEFISVLRPGELDTVMKDLKRLGNVLGWRHDIANLDVALAQLDHEESLKKNVALVRALAWSWDNELKQECLVLFKRVFKKSSVDFSQGILSPAV